MMRCSNESCRTEVFIDGALPKTMGIGRRELKNAAKHFAERSSRRIGVPFREVTVILQRDEESERVHLAINGANGATDVITQRYDPMPGEKDGVYGELYVNTEQAVRVAPKRKGWSAAKELLLYVAHGMDHLSGADDFSDRDRLTMRRRELEWINEIEKHT